MSFGTLATLEGHQLRALVEGLARLPVRVLFALRTCQQTRLPALPPSFRIEPFVPQQAVLAHPAVHLFASHCGMNSVSEGLYYGRPILALPIFGDQHYNAARVCDLGAGVRLDKTCLTADDVRNKAEALLREPRFAERARAMSQVLKRTRGREDSALALETLLEAGIGHLRRD
jgi:glucuronosyltransferase